MIEMRCLKNIVYLIRTFLSFTLSRKVLYYIYKLYIYIYIIQDIYILYNIYIYYTIYIYTYIANKLDQYL